MGFISSLFKGPPKPPNYRKVAEEQGQQSRDTAAFNASLNRIGQVGPYGSLDYTQHGTDPTTGAPIYRASVTLTPDQQAILDTLENNQRAIGGTVGNLVDNTASMYGSPVNLPDVPDFFTGATPVVNEMLSRHDAFMDPYRTREIENLDATMRNQGLFPGTPAYDRAMRELRDTQTRAQGQFLNTAQNQAFTQQQSQYQAQMEEALKEYGLPLDTIRHLMGLTTVGSPTFVTPAAATAQAPDITKLAMDSYNAQQAQYNEGVSYLTGGLKYVGGLPTGVGTNTIAGTAGAGLASLLGLV